MSGRCFTRTVGLGASELRAEEVERGERLTTEFSLNAGLQGRFSALLWDYSSQLRGDGCHLSLESAKAHSRVLRSGQLNSGISFSLLCFSTMPVGSALVLLHDGAATAKDFVFLDHRP